MGNENKKPDNPNAFPVDGVYAGESLSKGNAGMSLRDYFAAKAMQGLIASNDGEAGDRIIDIPEYAYDIADAMLKQREL